MLAAIEDGTLEPGERLNDDDLTAWLNVSRTPVREAIARLASELPGSLFASTLQTASALARFHAGSEDAEVAWAELGAEAKSLSQL